MACIMFWRKVFNSKKDARKPDALFVLRQRFRRAGSLLLPELQRRYDGYR